MNRSLPVLPVPEISENNLSHSFKQVKILNLSTRHCFDNNFFYAFTFHFSLIATITRDPRNLQSYIPNTMLVSVERVKEMHKQYHLKTN